MVPQPTQIFHITDIGNLPKIIANEGLHSPRILQQGTFGSISIAHAHIQDRRATTLLDCGPGGTLHDYVPFYFAPRSPMLCSIWKCRVEGYAGTQEQVVHLMTTVQIVNETGLGFVFANGHAIMALTDFYDDLEYLNEIDWDLMKAKYWADTLEDPDKKRRRQAEFLIYDSCPWTIITEIGVMTQKCQNNVLNILEGVEHKPVVTIHKDWYY